MPQPRLLLTRPHPGAAQFLDRLSPALRDGAVISPLIEIAPTGVGVDLAPFAGVIFTSANGVAHAPKGDGRPAFCVGPQTTAAAANRREKVVDPGVVCNVVDPEVLMFLAEDN